MLIYKQKTTTDVLTGWYCNNTLMFARNVIKYISMLKLQTQTGDYNRLEISEMHLASHSCNFVMRQILCAIHMKYALVYNTYNV
jgi:hypothetical protein